MFKKEKNEFVTKINIHPFGLILMNTNHNKLFLFK